MFLSEGSVPAASLGITGLLKLNGATGLPAHGVRQGERWLSSLLENGPVVPRRHRPTSAALVTGTSVYGCGALLFRGSVGARGRRPCCISEGEAPSGMWENGKGGQRGDALGVAKFEGRGSAAPRFPRRSILLFLLFPFRRRLEVCQNSATENRVPSVPLGRRERPQGLAAASFCMGRALIEPGVLLLRVARWS
ncbi:hypothetical protein ERJ75_001467300 [Trypanosoma vivax]|nr:hypothetical protein ERJ75_001467300 [Trypanosoma vivax]